MTELPRVSDVRERIVGTDERLVDFSPVRRVEDEGGSDPLYLFLTDRRLVVVRPDLLADDPDMAITAVDRADLAFVMLSGDTLRLLMADGPIDCRFPSPAVATAFRRGLTH